MLLISLSCRESPASPPRPEPGLSITLQGSLSDTVTAPPALVRITLVDSAGAPLAGASVQISVTAGAPFWVQAEDFGSNPPPTTTNTNGALQFYVIRWTNVGSGWIRIAATSGSTTWADSLHVTVTPGRPHAIRMPADSAIYQGNSGTWRATVTDRFENVRPDVPVFQAGSAGITVAGNTVHATAGPSRQLLRASLGSLRDSVWLSIVPRGQIAVMVDRLVEELPGADWMYARLELDGSAFQPLMTREALAVTGSTVDLTAEWLPDAEHVVFRLGDGIGRLNLAGILETLIPAPSAGFRLHCPVPSANGDFIFSHRTNEVGALDGAVAWRSPTGGGGSGDLSVSPGPPGVLDVCPSPSPDGRYLAVSSNRSTAAITCIDADFLLHVIDLQNGTVANLGVNAFPQVRWSPNGEYIVSAGCGIPFVIRPDGSGYRALGDADPGYTAFASWSPDGQWVAIERNGPRIDLIEVSTGLRLPLGFTNYLRMPSWRP